MGLTESVSWHSPFWILACVDHPWGEIIWSKIVSQRLYKQKPFLLQISIFLTISYCISTYSSPLEWNCQGKMGNPTLWTKAGVSSAHNSEIIQYDWSDFQSDSLLWFLNGSLQRNAKSSCDWPRLQNFWGVLSRMPRPRCLASPADLTLKFWF